MYDIPSVLIIAPDYPFPPDDGHKLRNYHLFKNFVSGYSFDILTFADERVSIDSEGMAAQLGTRFRNVRFVPSSTHKIVRLNKYENIKNIFSPSPLTIGSPYYSDEMAKVVNQEIMSLKYELIYFSGFSMFLYNKLKLEKHTYIVDVIDSLSIYLKNDYIKEKNIIKKIKCYLNYMWAVNYEKIHHSRASNMILVSSIDAEQVKKHCPASNVWVIPNGVDTDYYVSKNKCKMTENILLFTGVMNYHPNNESIIYFIKEILPLVKRRVPNVKLLVAGKNPMPELRRMATRLPGIDLTGYVADMRPYFDKAAIYIAPMISGAGLKNKILEAWAMSKPVVAFPLSCDGIDAVDGYNALIAGSREEFADKIVKVLSDPMQSDKLAKNGRKTVEKSYSWISKSKMLEEVFSKVLNM